MYVSLASRFALLKNPFILGGKVGSRVLNADLPGKLQSRSGRDISTKSVLIKYHLPRELSGGSMLGGDGCSVVAVVVEVVVDVEIGVVIMSTKKLNRLTINLNNYNSLIPMQPLQKGLCNGIHCLSAQVQNYNNKYFMWLWAWNA